MADLEDLGQLRQQVVGLDKNYSELRREVYNLDQKMDTKFSESDRKMDAGFATITALLDKKSSPQWQAYTLIVMILTALGGAFYYPMKTDSIKLDAQIETLRGTTVTRAEHERLWRENAVSRDEAVKLRTDLDYLRGQLHPLPK